jgi:flagellar basal-body rod protein FlgG
MNYGLYASFLGMRARQRTLDVMANNIANASTTGFKQDRVLYRSIEAAEKEAQQGQGNNPQPNNAASTPLSKDDEIRALAQKQGRSVGVITGSMIDFSAGPIKETGRPLDVTLDGDGFLAVQTPKGERYTRAGSLTLDSNGQLMTHDGYMVIGDGGPITLPQGEISIGEDGSISVGSQQVDRLKLVRFDNPNNALLKDGNSLFVASGKEQPQEATNLRVVQGALETSNISTISEMAAMIQNSREFDSLEKNMSILMNDLRRATSEIGKL